MNVKNVHDLPSTKCRPFHGLANLLILVLGLAPQALCFRLLSQAKPGSTVGDAELLLLDECEQLGVDLILMCGGDAVRRAGVVGVLCTFD